MFETIKSVYQSAPKNVKSHATGFSDFTRLLTSSLVEHRQLTPLMAVDVFLEVAPVADSVTLITDEFGSIKPVVVNRRTGEEVDKHPVLALLDNPNTNVTYSQFIKEFGMFLLTTGNSFVIATGPTDRPPVNLFIEPAQNVSIMPSGVDGLAKVYTVTGGGNYVRPTDGQLTKQAFRFFLENASALNEAELSQCKLPTLLSGVASSGGSHTALFGMSPLTPHWFDIQLYKESSIHNISLLKRGGLPSLIVVSKNPLSDEQYQKMEKSLERFHSGANNAARKMVVEGEELEIIPITNSNRDMDFEKLRQNVEESIAAAYKIPPALSSKDRMTFSNLQVARTMFYESSVLNKLDVVLAHLTSFLLSRYPNSEDLMITYNRNTIPELEPERIAKLKEQQELGVNTINELRKELSFDDAAGGDDIYRLNTQIPVASTTGVAPERPATMPAPETSPKSIFYDLMKQQIDQDGQRLYKDSEIEKLYLASTNDDYRTEQHRSRTN